MNSPLPGEYRNGAQYFLQQRANASREPFDVGHVFCVLLNNAALIFLQNGSRFPGITEIG